MIKCIVFDVGGVIKNSDAKPKIADMLGVNRTEFLDFWEQHKKQLSTGVLKEDKFCKMIEKQFGVRGALKAYKDVYKSGLKKFNKPILEYIKKLKIKYSVGLISNTRTMITDMNRNSDLYIHFFPCILSCEVGLAKPDPEIYKLFLEKSCLKPSECIVIDDIERNINVAKSLGFKTILFENNEKLKADLKTLGVDL